LDPNTSSLPEYWIRKIFLTSIQITGKEKKKHSHANLFISIYGHHILTLSPPLLLHQPTMATTAATPTRKPPPLDQNSIVVYHKFNSNF
jgi:hypothetical protein